MRFAMEESIVCLIQTRSSPPGSAEPTRSIMSRSPHHNAVKQTHSGAWIIQTWLSFALAVGVTVVGIWHLPVDGWQKAFLGMGLVFSIGSTFTLSKTVRDQHEQESLTARIDEARVTKLLAEVDPVSLK
jgi:hypothetical protein